MRGICGRTDLRPPAQEDGELVGLQERGSSSRGEREPACEQSRAVVRPRILVLSDTEGCDHPLLGDLSQSQFDASAVPSGRHWLFAVRQLRPDLVILDWKRFGNRGASICRALRKAGQTAVLMVTAHPDRGDRISALRCGVDDYIAKPVDQDELNARIQAVLRRTPRVELVELVELGPIRLDFRALRAWNRDEPLDLTYREFQVIRYLTERRGAVVTREEFLRDVWGYAASSRTRSLDQAIARLRQKLGRDRGCPAFIHTVHKKGYRLKAAAGL